MCARSRAVISIWWCGFILNIFYCCVCPRDRWGEWNSSIFTRSSSRQGGGNEFQQHSSHNVGQKGRPVCCSLSLFLAHSLGSFFPRCSRPAFASPADRRCWPNHNTRQCFANTWNLFWRPALRASWLIHGCLGQPRLHAQIFSDGKFCQSNHEEWLYKGLQNTTRLTSLFLSCEGCQQIYKVRAQSRILKKKFRTMQWFFFQ